MPPRERGMAGFTEDGTRDDPSTYTQGRTRGMMTTEARFLLVIADLQRDFCDHVLDPVMQHAAPGVEVREHGLLRKRRQHLQVVLGLRVLAAPRNNLLERGRKFGKQRSRGRGRAVSKRTATGCPVPRFPSQRGGGRIVAVPRHAVDGYTCALTSDSPVPPRPNIGLPPIPSA